MHKPINLGGESSKIQIERQSDKEEQIRKSNGAGESDAEGVIASRRQKPAKPLLTKQQFPKVKSQSFFTGG
ncbi:hypothetical protein HID58_001002 [Brassica napus]|uniref:Uncharacterized protein n=1 Tax=Brassica napus TaxID=3708 RepID=A0ABQ8EL40_BRANA|nr:hypothetical protein HID58_001002 [Brassica napus]